MSGHESVNKNVFESSEEIRQKRCRRNLRWQAVPEGQKPKMSGYTNSGTVNQRLNEAVAAWKSEALGDLEGRQRK